MHHDHNHANSAVQHGSIQSYLVGFILAVILTIIPFAVVMNGSFSKETMILTVAFFAILQIFVHLKYFLHLDFSKQSRSRTLSFLFTALVIVMLVGLSIWIIYSANYLMMD